MKNKIVKFQTKKGDILEGEIMDKILMSEDSTYPPATKYVIRTHYPENLLHIVDPKRLIKFLRKFSE